MSNLSRRQRQERMAGRISCSQCKRAFDSEARLEEHRSEMNHVCEECNAHFQYQSGLSTHMADKHGDDVQCDKCGAKLGRRDNHARHNHRFHETSEWYWCGYDGCTKEDYSAWNIKKHMENPSHPSHVGKTKRSIIKGIKTADEKASGVRGTSPARSMANDKLTAEQPAATGPTPRSTPRMPRPSYADVVKRSASMSPSPPTQPSRLEFPGSAGIGDYEGIFTPRTNVPASSVQQPSPPATMFINEPLYHTDPSDYGQLPTPNPSFQQDYLHPSSSYTQMGNQPGYPSWVGAWNLDTPLVGDGSTARHNHLADNLARSLRNPYETAQGFNSDQAFMANRGTRSMPPMPPYSRARRAARLGAHNKRPRHTLRPTQAVRGSEHGNHSAQRSQQGGIGFDRGSQLPVTPQNNGFTDHQRNLSSSIGRQSDIGKLDMSELASQINDYVNQRNNFPQNPRQADYDRQLLQDFIVYSTGSQMWRPNTSTNPVIGSSMHNGRHPTPPIDMEINVSDPPDLTEEYETITTLGFVHENRPEEQGNAEPRHTEQPHLVVTPEEVAPNVHWFQPEFNSIYQEGAIIYNTNDISVEGFRNEVDDTMEMSLYSDTSTTKAQEASSPQPPLQRFSQ